MSFDVLSWWALLCGVSALNVVAWALAAWALRRRRPRLQADAWTLARWQLALSAVYVAGCAYRSVLPVYDVPRLVLFDTWASSVVVGRSVATVAELCFVAQWALLLRGVSRATRSGVGERVAALMVPLIMLAEICSWYAVLTTSNLGHVLEESLWGLTALLLVASLVAIWPRCAPPARPWLAAWCALGVAYVAFMFMVDVPMYWSRWVADEAQGRAYLSLAAGWRDVAGRWVVSHQWAHWRSEVVWMSVYFSAAVWLSVALVHAPLGRQREAVSARRQGRGHPAGVLGQ